MVTHVCFSTGGLLLKMLKILRLCLNGLLDIRLSLEKLIVHLGNSTIILVHSMLGHLPNNIVCLHMPLGSMNFAIHLTMICIHVLVILLVVEVPNLRT